MSRRTYPQYSQSEPTQNYLGHHSQSQATYSAHYPNQHGNQSAPIGKDAVGPPGLTVGGMTDGFKEMQLGTSGGIPPTSSQFLSHHSQQGPPPPSHPIQPAFPLSSPYPQSSHAVGRLVSTQQETASSSTSTLGHVPSMQSSSHPLHVTSAPLTTKIGPPLDRPGGTYHRAMSMQDGQSSGLPPKGMHTYQPLANLQTGQVQTNLGPPPKVGETYRPPLNPPPPISGPLHATPQAQQRTSVGLPPWGGPPIGPSLSGGMMTEPPTGPPPSGGPPIRSSSGGMTTEPPPSGGPPIGPSSSGRMMTRPPIGPSSSGGMMTGPPIGPSSSGGMMTGPPVGPSSSGGMMTGPPIGPSSSGGMMTGPSVGPSSSGGMMTRPPIGPSSSGGMMTRPPTGPPTSRGVLTGPPTGPPPSGGMMTGPPTGPPPSGEMMTGPPTGPPPSGEMMTGPPTGPPISGGMMTGPPTGPPTSGVAMSGPPIGQSSLSGSLTSSKIPMGLASYPGAPPPTGLGPSQITGPPSMGPTPRQLSGQPGSCPTGQGLVAGPGSLGRGPGSHSGMMSASSQPDGMNINDPYLQPVNLLENRTILPPNPITPPPILLPGNQAKYVPDHRVFCCTMNAVPASSSLLNKLKLPLAIHIHPYKDMSPKECPVIHQSIIVRCRSCRAYINPYVMFVDSRHWRCNLCFRPNTVPDDFDYNIHTGQSGDRSHRVELKRSSVEYIAPSEYMVRPPQPCLYFFVLDVSYSAVDSGVLAVFCRCLLDELDHLPGDARTLVGLLTFDSSLHFYNFPSSQSQPQMLVVSDVDDVFLPCPDSLLVNLREYKETFRSLLEDLPRMFAKNQSDRSALGAALQAATKLLHPIGGRITVIQCSLPNIGPGSLKYREVAPPSTKMPTLNMAPASDFYKSLALDCNAQQIAIDIFAFSGQFMDLSTVGCAAKFSSGQIFHYHDFHHSRKVPRERFEKDFKRYLTRRIGFEAVMRIRCTEGLSLHTFHGNFFVRSTDLLSLPSVNPDLGYTINISIDDNLKEMGTVCFQAALLYTSSRGERRIRVHTLCLPVTTQLSQVYSRLNVLAIAGTLANMGVDRASNSSLGDARDAMMNTVIDCGKMYRTNVASSRQSSQFALPTSIRLLPLLVIALLKTLAFSLSSTVSYDRRTQAMNLIKCTPFNYLMCMMYPRMYAVHMLTEKDVVEKNGHDEIAPPILHLSAEKLNRYGVYLMDYGMGLYLWVCKDAPQEYLAKILGVQHFGAIPEIMCELPSLKNECSVLLNKLVRQIRFHRQHYMPFQVIREDGPHRLLFIEKLVDDRTELGTSYYEILSHIARQQSK